MNIDLLDILECPFCGGQLRLQPSPAPAVRGSAVESGILGCECCAYPVVDGIPVIRTGGIADRAMQFLGDGRHEDARRLLLDLWEPERAGRFDAVLREETTASFRAALEVLSRDAEGTYLLYRFSDPTFLCGQAVLEAVAGGLTPGADRVLDVCGGAGHLARSVTKMSGGAKVVVADIAYWKLWLAKRFVEPDCEPVCCDAAAPLPFARQSFSLTYCSDAFHYIWPRRLLAGEMMRATAPGGTVVVAHLHNALGENPSAGMPLTPAGYGRLFAERGPALFKQSDVLDAVVSGRTADLGGGGRADGELEREPALILLAGERRTAAGRVAPQRPAHGWTVNPLYAPIGGGGHELELRFPSAFYAEEFADARRYLPDRVRLPEGWNHSPGNGGAGDDVSNLVARRVLLDLPERYL